MQRYSIKRERILKCLMSTKEHPTAEWLYAQLKGEFPSLSLATVYRNLRTLKDEGLVRSVGIIDGQERFDADMTPHTHLKCIKCGKVLDASNINLPDRFFDGADMNGFSVVRAELSIAGICRDCKEKNNG